MEEMNDLKKRVDHLQYGEINNIKNEMNNMKVELSNNSLLTEQIMESNKKLGETMIVFKDTMVDIAESVKDANRVSSQLADTVEELNKKISSVEKNTKESIDDFGRKLDEIDEKSKVDILLWAKSNWFGIVGICGIIYTIVKQFI